MKFGSNLQTHLTPEWRSQYIEYERLKEMIYECQENLPSGDVDTEETCLRHVSQFEEQFFASCNDQLSKVNNFYAGCFIQLVVWVEELSLHRGLAFHISSPIIFAKLENMQNEKLAEATRRFALLQSEVHATKDSMQHGHSQKRTPRRVTFKSRVFPGGQEKVRLKTLKDIKLAFSEFYLSLILLQNYQDLNFTGFRKILKKHDKVLTTEKGASWRKQYVESSPFHTDHIISEYIQKTEKNYPKGVVFRVGLFLGMFLIIVAIIISCSILIDTGESVFFVIRLYRSAFLTFLFVAFLGVNIWGWRTWGVNHVLIFEIDPRQHLTHQHFFEISTMFAIVWGVSVVAFMFGHIPPLLDRLPTYLTPGLVFAAYLLFLFNPLPIFFHKARFWLLWRLWRLLVVGVYQVEFADFWLADQLTSMAVVLLDAEFLICFYASEGDIYYGRSSDTSLCGSYSYGAPALIACYPSLIRFVQCLRRFHDSKKWFPHLVNAGKYSTTFFRVTFRALYVLHRAETGEMQSVYFFLWVASSFVSSCYTSAWDIKMDWGFLDSNAGDNKLLREEIVYPKKSLYYFAILENLLIRFSWVVMVGVEQASSRTAQNVVANCLLLLEIYRRFVWNFFRLENEHLNNCGEFRAVRDISVTPCRADDLAVLEKMIDDEDGAEQVLLERARRRSTEPLLSGLRRSKRGSSVAPVPPVTSKSAIGFMSTKGVAEPEPSSLSC